LIKGEQPYMKINGVSAPGDTLEHDHIIGYNALSQAPLFRTRTDGGRGCLQNYISSTPQDTLKTGMPTYR